MPPKLNTVLLAASILLAIGCGDSGHDVGGSPALGGTGGSASGGGLGGFGGVFPKACPGFESEPGAGCPAPCSPLVEGGPGGRAYCTVECSSSDTCPARHGCASANAGPRNVTVCLQGPCDQSDAGSCADNLACNPGGPGYCYPSPGTKTDRCQPYAAAAPADCTGLCDIAQPLPDGVLCTTQCEQFSAAACFAGDSCDVDIDEGQPFGSVCIQGCATAADCPGGIECVQRYCLLF